MHIPIAPNNMAKKLAATLFACLVSQGSVCLAAEFVSVFSSYKVYPSTGDCGGHTLTIVREDKSRLISGYMQTYEGNCEAAKVPITNVHFNSGKGSLSFAFPTYVQDGKGVLVIVAERRFVGVLRNYVTGEIQYCPISDPCNSSEMVNLSAVAKGTPE
jgi:hypothetical protein